MTLIKHTGLQYNKRTICRGEFMPITLEQLNKN
jgi:hypothetical protein